MYSLPSTPNFPAALHADSPIYFTPHSPSDMADKIVSFINMDTEQKDQLIALESKRLLNFSWKNTAKEIDRMILELVN